MATRVIYSLRRCEFLKEDGYFEIKKQASKVTDRMLRRLYKDEKMGIERFFTVVKKHYNDFIYDEDMVYFYTNEYKPMMIDEDF